MSEPTAPRNKFQILIVGAGVAGLSTAYALKRSQSYESGLVDYRIIEKRKEPGVDLGYPIHLSSAGLNALLTLLLPSDLVKLDTAKRKIPVYHDGITVSNNKGETVYRLIRDSGVRPMIQREDLMKIFRDELGNKVEYGKEVKGLKDVDNGIEVTLNGEEKNKFDLVIGADGMFSSIRQLSSSKAKVGKSPWTVINSITSSESILKWVKDPISINTIYGDSFSATLIPLSSHSSNSVNPSAPSHVTQSHMLHSTSGSSSHCRSEPDTTAQPCEPNPVCRGPDSVYVALTIPSSWLEPSFAHHMAACTCEPTMGSSFVRDLENSDGWSNRKGFTLYALPKTVCGNGRTILIGDASHGTVPFCGSGASSAIVDSLELVNVMNDLVVSSQANSEISFPDDIASLHLNLVTETKERDLFHAIEQFRKSSIERNDPLIKESKELLWLAQGETAMSYLVRGVVFWSLELGEKVSGRRRKLERELRKVIDNEDDGYVHGSVQGA
ncbi:uncharacterized protein IL334_005834 [Kwoniella shivajii]|uniref:FAD-binding domain-containing protein n=1 Tax=Kwoniella shivajii TaxID=564305 RepID=A0ABZ1D4K1_9TREE|nr:hypothetical protein IL334_005834 [Kwoniella shivajii]